MMLGSRLNVFTKFSTTGMGSRGILRRMRYPRGVTGVSKLDEPAL